MSRNGPTRRRVLTIFAAAAAGALAGRSARAAVDYEWRGVAMGADATILFSGIAPEAARAAAADAAAEIERLESALSLFRPDSELSRLNRDKILERPSGDLRRALGIALDIAAASGGLFDPTVQALWETYVDWFAARPDAGLPPDAVLAAPRAALGWRSIAVAPEAIRIGAAQRLTLNGLGQGYVTDRVADLFAARGLTHVLVDLGEQRALAPRADGAPWRVTRANAPPITLNRGALATSEGSGCVLGTGGAAHHLFDPRSGRSAAQWRRITVHHRSAAIADALSTALYAASAMEIEALMRTFTGVAVWARDRDGREHRFVAPPLEGLAT